jgi:hypothetical protein
MLPGLTIDVHFLLLRPQYIAIAVVVRNQAEAFISFVLSVYPVPKAFGTGQFLKNFHSWINNSISCTMKNC